jgi:PAS domain S-box-containing protein
MEATTSSMPKKRSRRFSLYLKQESELYLQKHQQQADRVTDWVFGLYTLLGILAAHTTNSWYLVFGYTGVSLVLYLVARLLVRQRLASRLLIGGVYALFTLQIIGQLHGMSEAQFVFFINLILMMRYQDGRVIVPYIVVFVVHQLSIMAATALLFMPHLAKYYISYTQEAGLIGIFLQFGLAILSAWLCAMHADANRKNALGLLEAQLDAQIKAQKLAASEEELRQNFEDLQTTQEHLIEAQERFDLAIQGVNDGIWDWNLRTDTVYFSPTIKTMLGYSDEEVDNSFEGIQALVHPEDIDMFRQEVTDYLDGHRTEYRVEMRLRRKNGNYAWILSRGKALRDKNGQAYRFIGSHTDITQDVVYEESLKAKNEELAASEEELRQNLEELHATQEALEEQSWILAQQTELLAEAERMASIASFRIDPQTNYFQYSNNLPLLYGFASDETPDLMINALSDYIHPEDREVPERLFERAIQEHLEEPITCQYRFKLPQQEEWRYFKAFVRTFQSLQGKHMVIGAVQDVSETVEKQKAIEEIFKKIKNSETKLRQNVTELKDAQEALASQKEKLEKAYSELKNTQSQLIQSEKMATLGQLVANIAHEINTPLGAIRSSSGNMTNILEELLRQDLPFLKTLSDEESQLFEKLVGQALETQQLLTTREKRNAKYELIETLEKEQIGEAQNIADLLVDMNVYQNVERLLARLHSPQLVDIIKSAHKMSSIIRSNQTIHTATERASKIIFALKNFARQDHSGEQKLTNINESIETTLTLYYNQLKHGVEVVKEMGRLPETMTYADEIVQVWTNIIHNAIQAMKGKGTISVRTWQEAELIKIAIGDSGPGIPEDIRDKIFSPFFTTKKAGEGSGLGLDIVRKIVEKHEGRIYFESEIGQGTTFYIELPVVSQNPTSLTQ